MIKPVILLGNGARNAPRLLARLAHLDIPVLTTWMAADLIPETHPAYCGRPGIIGMRAANIIQQKATHLYVFGARLDGDQTAYNYANFAPHAEKHVWDIDQAELNKLPDGWHKYRVDCAEIDPYFPRADPAWLGWCKRLYYRYPTVLVEHWEDRYVNPFAIVDFLSDFGRPDDVFAIGSSGQAPCTFYQAFRVKAGQRVCNLSTYGAMGADIPCAIGACIGSGRKRTICVTGDGGFMLNIHELEVVRRLSLPIIFIVYRNDGYNSIRQMQKKRFNGRLVACDPSSRFTLPQLAKIADSYDIDYAYVRDSLGLKRLRLNEKMPQIIGAHCDPDFIQYPRVDSTTGPDGIPVPDPMEDMTPKLPRDELQALMEWNG